MGANENIKEIHDKNGRLKKLKDALPVLWNSYEHMYNSRTTQVSTRVNFLLVTVSFLSVISLSLFPPDKSAWFLVPVIPQFAALLILLKYFLPSMMMPWFEPKSTLDTLERNSFEMIVFATLKASEEETGDYLSEMKYIVGSALSLIIISVYLMILLYLQLNVGDSWLYTSLWVIVAVSVPLLMCFYKKKRSSRFTHCCITNLKNTRAWLKK